MAPRPHRDPSSSCWLLALLVVCDGLFGVAHRSDQLRDDRSRGCTTAGCWWSRCSRPAICSAPVVRSCSCAMWAGAWPRRGSRFPGGCARNGSRLRSSRPCCSATSCSTSGRFRARRPGWCSRTSRCALVVDLTFTGATFCKYLCPIGQFNFVASTMLAARVADKGARHLPDVAGRSIASKAHGARRRPRSSCSAGASCGCFCRRRSATRLHALPRLRACLSARQHRAGRAACLARSSPIRGGDRASDGWRSAGTSRRLPCCSRSAACMNAFGMIAPVRGVERWVSQTFGVTSEAPALGVLFVAVLIVAPLLLLGGGAAVTRQLAGDRMRSAAQIAVNYAYALVPFGFGMWLAHYGFHLLTGAFDDRSGHAARRRRSSRLAGARRAAVAADRDASRVGVSDSGRLHPARHDGIAFGRVSDLGTRLSRPGRGRLLAAWLSVIALLAAVALWILSQPMEMRGTGFAGMTTIRQDGRDGLDRRDGTDPFFQSCPSCPSCLSRPCRVACVS